MALDGSFSLEWAVKRFLGCCQDLGSVEKFDDILKKFDDLLKKEHMMTEEEVVNLLVELFLNPKFTILLIGCFRPIAHKIIDRAVVLLQQCNLRSNVDDMDAEPKYLVDKDNECVYLVDYYNQHGKGVELHEFACLAFCRALYLDHSLWRSVSAYFIFSPPPFQRLLRSHTVNELSKGVSQCLLAVRISYRLLLMEPEFFSHRWNWSCFLDLVDTINLNRGNGAGHEKDIADIRWCGVQILSVILKMNDRATENFGIGVDEAASCLLRWEEFCQDVAMEKVASYIISSEDAELRGLDLGQQKCLKSLNHNSLISTQLYEVEPAIKSPRLATWDVKSAGSLFLVTPTVKKSFEMVLLAVSQKWPVLLYGPAGSGKTALVNKLARDARSEVLSIHMDDQIDGKTLIGSYVCTEKPGEFRWQPGSLVQAVLNGYWVVFEDIDKASSDVQSILLPLLEGAGSFVTSHGEEIRVAESFRLFSTISMCKNDGSRSTEGGSILSILWRRVMIRRPNNDDLQIILKTRYPDLEPLSGKLVETLEKVNSLFFDSSRRFSLRDLLKWCKRISTFCFNYVNSMLTADQSRCIYQEAVDIFAAQSMSAENRLNIMKEIARLWKVLVTDAGILHPYKPELQVSPLELRIGRVALQPSEAMLHGQESLVKMRSSLHALERIACSVKYNEPVLLVGETGTGKTTLVQNLAMMLGQRLSVLNLSQQSDVADLLGGFKPMEPQSICVPLYKEFVHLFSKAFSLKENDKLFAYLQKQLSTKNWIALLNGFKKYVDSFQKKVHIERSGSGKKRKKPLNEVEKLTAWEKFSVKLEAARGQLGASSGMTFSFVEGAFITALRNGEWILLDEVNLAPPETLQRLVGVLEGEHGSLCLAERGDASYIARHPNFRMFACMNPATDAGKRDLPYSLRSRFTEYFVDDVLNKEDLRLFIHRFMEESRSDSKIEEKIIDFYGAAKRNSEERLQDGANQKPQYSLRSLYRALEYTNKAKGKFGFQKAMYDGFSMFFLTLLDRPSAKIMKKMIKDKLLGGNKPSAMPFDAYLGVKKDSISDDFLENYVLTKSVKKQLENLARAVFIKKYPVLLQGPTSSGKTSLVQYLAARTGHEFVRINNHEHTDLQEYLGSYISDAYGKLIFHEGALVKAVRNGYWIVLDELNLAPSDVLEALNRLLDDNRELYVPELRETIRAHPNFMLFATQNPPAIYGGRKMLSRAFRNRFVEVHVDEIPDYELSTIVEKRGKIPSSRAKLMVEVMKELQLLRQSSKVFAGKHGFITPRDLFRWANRLRTFGFSKEVMAEHGYYLLADRLRDEGERNIVQEVLEKLIRVKIIKEDLYKDVVGREMESVGKELGSSKEVILTRSMRRLLFLVKCCFELREPVLLVGETGGGKTTVCQLLSRALGAKLHILNCHQYTETSDFLGGFYPIRERSRLMSEFKHVTEKLMLLKAFIHFPHNMEISSDIGQASLTLDRLGLMSISYRQGRVSCPAVTSEDLDLLDQMTTELIQLHHKWQTIFMWQDGPLVQSMKAGDLFLLDEISLADDSVLERLNSVLEPERKLSLAEKGGSVMEEITAHENFFVLATMNPGGDYGKKELSPALRNRFTEIWVPPVSDLDELRDIAFKRLVRPVDPKLTHIVDAMLNFWEWFNQLGMGKMLTVRDLISWIEFVKVTNASLGPEHAFLHGLFLVLLDGLCLGTGISKEDASLLREKCFSFILKLLELDDNELFNMENYGWADRRITADTSCSDNMLCNNVFGIHPFYIEKGYEECDAGGFEFLAPTTRRNALRVLRAMQLPKPALLEGSPGVGKTSLIIALGKYSGHKVVRINLSEQTDLMDLLGSDLPVDSDEGMKFAWSDGILLQALKEGCWVLLDELNLAPQSVLEGLNAILDHRAEVFIPELGLTFKCPPSFRIFACQNPFSQGGGRKGLPRSFLNRFTKVYIDELAEDDYLFICSSLYPSIPRPVLSKLISFNKRLHEEIMLYHKFAQNGSPWEFNLRDVLRSCQIIQGVPEKSISESFVNILYVQRMRTAADRQQVLQLYEEVFGEKPLINPYPRVELNPEYLFVGTSAIKRNSFQSWSPLNNQLNIMPYIRHSLEAVAHSVEHQWLCILVGPSSSGKTSLIRLLAQLTGNVLNELNLSSATDISELLGCFEQYNAYRNIKLVVAKIEQYVNQYFSLQLKFSKAAFVSERKGIIAKWFAFLSATDSGLASTSNFSHLENWGNIIKSLSLLVDIIEQLKSDMENYDSLVSESTEELDRMKAILKLQIDQKKESFSAKFEWVTGLLIKAIENGEWLVLENANLCNPTVLDRINSLVEPSGSITINERGIVDGSPMVIFPHPSFRMFLTVNPSYGEVSRAMRNRGVEIFLMQPYWLLDEASDHSCAEFELKDVKRFITLSDIPFAKLVDSMAKAHLYARNEGRKLDVQVTYLELSRWIQLFQQLLRKGNQTLWSLQISWEHTYLSSLGEAMGWEIINYAKVSYLSREKLPTSNLPAEFSLYVPEGWLVPLKVRDFILYSRETSVKQNCLYLEYLVAQCELGETWNGGRMDQVSSIANHEDDWLVSSSCDNSIFDWKLINKMIFFATNWAIEQAHDGDYKLYFLCFDLFSSKLQHCSRSFSSFFTTLKQGFEHPIWKHFFSCQHKLSSLNQVDRNLQPIPLLSLGLINLNATEDVRKASNALLYNAMLSYQQWNAQSAYQYSYEARHFRPVLESLQMLEREILDMLVQFPSNDVLSKLYSDLVEDHIFFWDTFVSSQDDALPIAGPLLIAWHSLTKDISRLHNFCPRAADNVLLMASKNLDKVFTQRSEQSLLWIYGGHPILPASEDLSEVQKQLLDQCESIWPTGKNQFKQVNDGFTQVVASSGRELRFLALKGISMSSYITSSKSHEEVFQFVQQLKEMGQMLMERLRYEKHKLEVKLQSDEHALVEENLASCCVFSPEILCTSSGYFSWQETVPILDGTSLFLDRELLQKLLSLVLVDPSGLQQALCDASKLLLEFALKFSLTSSTRPPQNFVPHQKILWILDAWTAVNDANGKITSYVLEMWSCWHCSLWNHCPKFLKNLSKTGDHDIPQPDMLFQPIGTATVCQILQSTCAIKDYFLHSLKLKVASCNFWQSFPAGTSLNKFLLFVGRSLFEQIIYAHEKAFNHDKFARIKSIFCSFQNTAATEEVIQELSSLIASSSHQKLKSSLKLFIEPVLGELYLPSLSPDFHLNIGYAWLRVGGLRFNLLLSCNNLDPVMKYSCKDKQIEGKISSLELEIKVREECNYIAGWPSSRMADKNRTEALERLKVEHQRLQRKLVFRCNPSKYSALRKECEEFWELSHLQKVLSSDGIKVMEKQEIFDQLCNWQEIATAFINRLADEYKDYSDVAQPFQVAVYEMKLGLSLLLSGALQKKFLNQIEEDNMDQVTESIYSFLRFPGGHAFKSISFDIIDVPTNFWELETSLVEKLVPFAREEKSEQVASFLHQKPAFHQNILAHVVRFVADSHRIDHASFKTLTSIFYQYACKWLSFKVKTKEKGGHDVQEYKFRPRAFMIKSVVDVDISALGKLFSDDSFMEWQELLSEEEYPEKIEPSAEDESLEEEWNLMGETSVNSMVHIHNQLFGSNNLIQNPQTFYISDADRLLLFTDSYRLGAGMIRGLKGLHASSLDAKLVPEHLLRLCLEHERMVGSSQKQCSNYNFYKDSNTPVMAKMVKLLTTLQQQILVLLNEWEDHPALKKIMDVIDMLLAIPMDTPLAKALSGLQFLLNRARVLQENGSKFPLSDQMQPIISLVCSWKKMELDSWPALLDDVQDQYEINAAKLWFPLYSLLHHHDSGNLVAYEQSTIESLEEFIRTSSVGEFQKRLQLLFAFHGQITNGVCLEADTYASPRQEVNLKILYNVFGYYVQFLPRIMELIKVNRRNIEKELTEVVKLCHWERTEACLSLENSKRTRQKLKKLIQKYTDFLQQPVMLVLNHEVEQTRINIQTLQGPRPLNDTEKNASLFDIPVDLMPLSDKKRSAWFSEWSKKREHTLQNLDPDWTSNLNFLNYEDVVSIIRESLATESKCLLHWRQWDVVCQTLERIHQTAIECDELWKEAKNNLGKKRAFSELLKLLESSGLQKHKFEIIEASNDSKWFSEPAYNSEHLLLTQSRLSYQDSDTPAACLPNEYLDREWKTANQLYFQSLASVQHLLQVRLRPHEDITNEQVNRSVSFVSHLINMQQKQRASAYAFAKSLNCLREYVSALEKLYTKCTGIDQINRNECSIARNKSDLFKCLWKQKLLFDGLTAMLVEESLLLKMVESTHLKSCQIVKPSANHAVQFIENFIPIMQRSKELLDSYLLGRGGSTCANPICPYVIPKQMQELAGRNFEVIRKFEVDFHKQDFNRSSVMGALFGHFDDPIKKGKLLADQFKQFDSGVQEKHESLNSCEHLNSCSDSYSDLESEFDEAFKKTLRLIMDALRQCSTGNGNAISEESLGKITSWEYLFTSSVANLNLEEFCKNLLGTITCADKLVNHSETDASCLSNKLGACFEHLHALSDLMLHLSDGLLQDLLTLHETVSVMTLILANVFAALFSKGFGIPVKDLVDDASHDISQNASGTGMGEGCGLNDISDQITDEDQLLGTSEKPGEEDASDKIPSKNDKGIEMEQDFEADAFSVSEDSEEESAEDNEGNEDEQLESATGNGGADSEVVDEKLWDKEEDENPDNKNEKYESGPSVRDRDVNSRELRAKDDSAALAKEKPAELGSDEIDKQNHEVGNQDDISDKEENGVDKEENGVDVSMDKEEAFADPTGIKLDEPNQGSDEDMDMDEDMNEGEDLDSNEEIGPEEDNVSGDNVNREEDNISPTDETMEEAENQPADGASEKNGLGGDSEEKSETNAMAPRKDVGMGIFDMISAHRPNAKSATQPYGDMQASASQNNTPEANMSATGEAYNNLAPLRGLPSGDMSEMDVMLPDQSFSGRFTDQRKSEFPLQESSTRRESQLNPYRNVGDALEEWKERVKVSVDLQPGNEEVANEIEDKNADEYGYVPEFEKGTAQALGSATSEQSDANVNGRKPDEDGLASQRDDATDMEIEKQSSGEWQIKPCVSNVKNKMGQQTQISDFEKSERERSPEVHDHDDIEPEPENISESLVSVRRSYLSKSVHELSKLSVDDIEMENAPHPEEVSIDIRSNAAVLWRKYELVTTRLSHELAEQLRLVMEPTLASKLQGDYKTGKRINMKKVIPYIASHYRKDKIWLRRTRPNRRDYQVVIAVDDSRSMSESCCGDVAVEALVTVCRAMSLLEMGNLAVASFGKKGNVRLLHDFDQPFTGEAGINIISNLTFRQENTIADEPVVDLLRHLNNMLDVAVARARLPSGQNPLQQLVLIIADGRFHEKEKLKRCVRDFLSQKRMVAFLLLDSPQESIMDHMEASFVGEGEKRVLKFTKYLDSFPFPYYIVLRNIEALPRTLADLLRQWFELMQHAKD